MSSFGAFGADLPKRLRCSCCSPLKQSQKRRRDPEKLVENVSRARIPNRESRVANPESRVPSPESEDGAFPVPATLLIAPPNRDTLGGRFQTGAMHLTTPCRSESLRASEAARALIIFTSLSMSCRDTLAVSRKDRRSSVEQPELGSSVFKVYLLVLSGECGNEPRDSLN